jgi:thiamine-monophosphate kinase
VGSLGELGEFGFIERLRQLAPGLSSDDDAAVVGGFAVTTDALVDGVHFRTDWSSPTDIGWKAVSVNVSDLAAEGATPTWLVTTVCAPPSTSLDLLTGIYEGIGEACESYGCALVGGDTVRAAELVLSVTAIGRLDREPLRRSRARVGDVLAVTGPLGRAACGVNLLLAGDPKDVPVDDALACVEAHRRPIARIDAAETQAHAAIDISDGLASDARRLAEASGHGIAIDTLPIAPEVERIAAARGWDAERIALAGGEDFELLFALDDAHLGGLIPIGRVVDEPGVWYKGEPMRIEGFDHFSPR